MKNITIYTIKQNILASVLKEISVFTNFKTVSYDNFLEFNKNLEVKKPSVIVLDLKDHKSLIKNNINIPILYLDYEFQSENLKNLNIINCPFKLKNFVEKINITFLKNKFLDNSNLNILNYKINLNSKKISNKQTNLKLTEREIDFILFLKEKKEPQSIASILKNVWKYSDNLETHTVETHVHRLRKKFIDSFKDNNFIKVGKSGYFI